MRYLFIFFLVCMSCVSAFVSGAFHDTVKIALLDKVTAKKETHTLTVGEKRRVGQLQIRVLNAWRAAEDEFPEAKVYFLIEDMTRSEKNRIVFKGWMFQSNVSVNALEHPTYDLWVEEVSGDEPTLSAEALSDIHALESSPQEQSEDDSIVGLLNRLTKPAKE